MNLTKICTILIMIVATTNVFAAPTTSLDAANSKAPKSVGVTTQQKVVNKDTDQQYQTTINEYRQYLETVSPAVMEEIKNFRIDNIKLNNQKRDLWKKLSTQAQEALKKQREYKKKLPIHINKSLNDELYSNETKSINIAK